MQWVRFEGSPLWSAARNDALLAYQVMIELWRSTSTTHGVGDRCNQASPYFIVGDLDTFVPFGSLMCPKILYRFRQEFTRI
ncbi:hypothetical protein IQ268_00730 [Oculatella sp. LEGE 06141]|uniref:hypothetical protein n=1 Tax=Oculatella sp. LEGE 06141 TaxID=1828648 RepID=UPI001882C95B|nr:hypothetical protein [Oculatella sp. LEGE 06141]MBE9177099.1 hypothetical protein [Oculatella sp. LEGE 06141]